MQVSLSKERKQYYQNSINFYCGYKPRTKFHLKEIYFKRPKDLLWVLLFFGFFLFSLYPKAILEKP